MKNGGKMKITIEQDKKHDTLQIEAKAALIICLSPLGYDVTTYTVGQVSNDELLAATSTSVAQLINNLSKGDQIEKEVIMKRFLETTKYMSLSSNFTGEKEEGSDIVHWND